MIVALRFKTPRRAPTRLSPEDVRVIVDLIACGVDQASIAERFSVSVTMISYIATGRRWAEVSGIEQTPRLRRLTDTERAEILRLRSKNLPVEKIAVETGRSFASVYRVIRAGRA